MYLQNRVSIDDDEEGLREEARRLRQGYAKWLWRLAMRLKHATWHD